jgi:site-specific recombinase XerD
LEVERDCGAATRNQRLAAIHGFYKFLQIEVPEQILLCQQILAIPYKKHANTLVNFLTLKEVEGILRHPNPNSKNGRRDIVLLSLLYDSGARVQEIADLSVMDVSLVAPETIRLTGKGRKTRIVPLMGATVKLLHQYFDENKLDASLNGNKPLFVNQSKHKMTRAGIAYVLKKHVNEMKSEGFLLPANVSPHCFRHSKAMHLLQAGVNLVYIRDFLGHSDIQTTEIYARADETMKRNALTGSYDEPVQAGLPAWHLDKTLMEWLHSL